MKILKKIMGLATIIIVSQSCLKDTGTRTYKVYTPVVQSTATLRSQVKSQPATAIKDAGKLFTIGNYVYVNEKGKGIHVIDNTNPSSPINKSFIAIPGNYDVAVAGNYLYADCYTDMLTINISNPNNITVSSFIEDMFSDKRYVWGYSTPKGSVVTDWIIKDTVVDIELKEGQGIWSGDKYITTQFFSWGPTLGGGVASSPSATSNTTGKAGSTSRFAIQNNYLYAVSNSSLHVVNISNLQNPSIQNTKPIGWNIETIFPFKDKLFIGSQTGMMIYSVSTPTNPQYISAFSHARLCDPVIADDNYAYVTLHASENICVGTQNELNVIDIRTITSPSLLQRINLTKPQGLSKDGNVLLVCDDDAGLRVFNAANPQNPLLQQTIALKAAYDVICINGVALVTAKDGLYQFDYSNINNVRQLSKVVFE